MKGVIYALLLLAAGVGWACGPFATPQAVQTPEPPPRPQAPAGTFYVLSYFATLAPHGPIGWTPGQEVYLDTSRSAPANGKLVAITDGAHPAVVSRLLLTRDPDTAAALRTVDEAGQEQLRAVNAALLEASRAREMTESMATAARIDRASRMLFASSAWRGARLLDQPASPVGAIPAVNANISVSDNMGLSILRNGDTSAGTGSGANGDVAAAAAAAQSEAARDRGGVIPAGLISRFANDAFHLDYLRDQP